MAKHLDMLRRWGHENNDDTYRVDHIAICLLLYHLIGRVDDVARIEVSDTRGHDVFDFALEVKVGSPRNLGRGEHNLNRILLGSRDE